MNTEYRKDWSPIYISESYVLLLKENVIILDQWYAGINKLGRSSSGPLHDVAECLFGNQQILIVGTGVTLGVEDGIASLGSLSKLERLISFIIP